MQKSIIVSANYNNTSNTHDAGLTNLNRLLGQGWRISDSCNMGYGYCLVTVKQPKTSKVRKKVLLGSGVAEAFVPPSRDNW